MKRMNTPWKLGSRHSFKTYLLHVKVKGMLIGSTGKAAFTSPCLFLFCEGVVGFLENVQKTWWNNNCSWNTHVIQFVWLDLDINFMPSNSWVRFRYVAIVCSFITTGLVFLCWVACVFFPWRYIFNQGENKVSFSSALRRLQHVKNTCLKFLVGFLTHFHLWCRTSRRKKKVTSKSSQIGVVWGILATSVFK